MPARRAPLFSITCPCCKTKFLVTETNAPHKSLCVTMNKFDTTKWHVMLYTVLRSNTNYTKLTQEELDINHKKIAKEIQEYVNSAYLKFVLSEF